MVPDSQANSENQQLQGYREHVSLYDFPYFVRKCGWRDGSAARAVYVKAAGLSGWPKDGNSWAASQVGSVLAHRLQLPGPPHPSLRLCAPQQCHRSLLCLLSALASGSGSVLLAAAEAERGERKQDKVRPGSALCLFRLVGN